MTKFTKLKSSHCRHLLFCLATISIPSTEQRIFLGEQPSHLSCTGVDGADSAPCHPGFQWPPCGPQICLSSHTSCCRRPHGLGEFTPHFLHKLASLLIHNPSPNLKNLSFCLVSPAPHFQCDFKDFGMDPTFLKANPEAINEHLILNENFEHLLKS